MLGGLAASESARAKVHRFKFENPVTGQIETGELDHEPTEDEILEFIDAAGANAKAMADNPAPDRRPPPTANPASEKARQTAYRTNPVLNAAFGPRNAPAAKAGGKSPQKPKTIAQHAKETQEFAVRKTREHMAKEARYQESIGSGDPNRTGLEGVPLPRGDELRSSAGAFSAEFVPRFKDTPEGRRGNQASDVILSILGVPEDFSPGNVALSLAGLIPGAAIGKAASKLPVLTRAVHALDEIGSGRRFLSALEGLDTLEAAQKAAIKDVLLEAHEAYARGGMDALQEYAKKAGHEVVDRRSNRPSLPVVSQAQPMAMNKERFIEQGWKAETERLIESAKRQGRAGLANRLARNLKAGKIDSAVADSLEKKYARMQIEPKKASGKFSENDPYTQPGARQVAGTREPLPVRSEPPPPIEEPPLTPPVETPPVQSAPPPNSRAMSAEEALEQAAREYQKGATPKTGGMGSKKRGAAQVGDAADVVKGVADMVRSGAARRPGAVSRLITETFGNTFDLLKSFGPAGKEISKDLEKVYVEAGAMEASRGFRVRDAVRSVFGRVPGFKESSRDALGITQNKFNDIVTKVENGVPLSAKEKRVWDPWVKVNKEIADDGELHGVLVDRVVDGSKIHELEGQTIKWFDGTNKIVKEGKVKSSGPDGLVVDIDGEDFTLPVGHHFSSRSLVDPERFFPREIKRGILEKLKDEGSAESKRWATYLIEKGAAKDEEAARAIMQRALHPVDVEVSGPMSSRLRISRMGVLLPDEFYNRNFLDVAERHIRRTSLEIAAAKVWGSDRLKLHEIMKANPSLSEDDGVQKLLAGALGKDRDYSITGQMRKFAAGEGAIQSTAKLTGLMTMFRQLSQAQSSVGILGGRASWRGFIDAGKSLFTDRAKIDMVKLSGVIDQDILALQGVDDVQGVLRVVPSIALSPLKFFDRSLRVHGALTGIAAFEDAVSKLKVVDGVIKRDASYRLLEDWFDFSDDDIVRLANGEKSKRDILQAMAGGVKTQVRARPVDLPKHANHPFGKIFWRFQTFAYGQSRVFGWAVKEASKGNAVPLLRLAAATGTLGELSADVVDEIKRRITHDERPARISTLKDINSLGEVGNRLYQNALETGTLGLWQKPLDWYEHPDRVADTAVSVKSIMNLYDSVIYGSESESDFLKKIEAAVGNFSQKEIVLWKQYYQLTHKGKTYRQDNPKPKKKSKG